MKSNDNRGGNFLVLIYGLSLGIVFFVSAIATTFFSRYCRPADPGIYPMIAVLCWLGVVLVAYRVPSYVRKIFKKKGG